MHLSTREIEILINNLLMLSILIGLILKRDKLAPYANYMILAIAIDYIVDVICFYFFHFRNDGISILYTYTYGLLFLFFLVIFLFYQKIIMNTLYRKIASIVIVVFVLSFILNILFVTDIKKDGFPTSILLINVFLLLVFVTLFLLDTFKTNLILTLKNYYPFWFSFSLIFIFVGVIPELIISKIASSTMSGSLWSIIMFLINFVGYGIMFLGLFYAKKVNKE